MADGNAAFVDESVMMAGGNATFVDVDVSFADGNASFTYRDMLFTDGNAAARTFGRAHRRRPTIFRMARVTRLPANSLPLHKIKEDCVVEVFDGGW